MAVVIAFRPAVGVGRMQSASFCRCAAQFDAKLLAHLASPIKLVSAGNSKRVDLHPPYACCPRG
jgi:hypothetical protein